MTCRRSNMKSSISSGLRVSRKLVAIQSTTMTTAMPSQYSIQNAHFMTP